MTAATTHRARDTAGAFPQTGRLAYIDGIRAIAIIAVVAFHAHIPGFRGGFVGVDVFFVISGFLITHQIGIQMLAGRFSATDFYARRILRIFPPLLLVTVVTVAMAPLFPLLPHENNELIKSAAATAAMISNYYFSFRGTGYFSQDIEINPLLHTWSLGVEEQYYLLAPAVIGVIVAVAARRKWDPIRALLGFGVLSIVLYYVTLELMSGPGNATLAFFSIMTRAWQFASGGTLAFLVLRGSLIPERWRSAFGIAGLLAIAISVHFYTELMVYPGRGAGLLPTFGTVLLLASGLGNERGPLTHILASRPAVAIGLVSYSWYLWHWPLTELARTLAIGPDSVWKDVTATSIALLLAVPTYLFLERPLKTLRRSQITQLYGGRIIAGGLAGSALISLLVLAAGYSPVFDLRVQPIEAGGPSRALEECRSQPKLTYHTTCVVGVAGEPDVVFIGDSHARSLTPIAVWSARDAGRTAMVLARNVCPPLKGIEIAFWMQRTCVASNDQALSWILESHAHPVVGVVLTARWPFYDERETPARETHLPRLLWNDAKRSGRDFETKLTAGVSDLIATLTSERRVLVVAPVPELRRSPEDCLLRARLNGLASDSCLFDRADVEQRRARAMRLLTDVVAKFPNARLADPLDAFCDRDKCRSFGPNALYYADRHHLSAAGAEVMYRHLIHDFRWVYGGN
jgi:peptidoglycan/LPS O-acetylase OafA/YrhL